MEMGDAERKEESGERVRVKEASGGVVHWETEGSDLRSGSNGEWEGEE